MSKIVNRYEKIKPTDGELVPQETYEVVSTNSGSHANISITLRITETCDLQCNYCHWYAGQHYDHDDVIATIDKLFEFFVVRGFKDAVFYYHGGEATRYPRVIEVLKYIKQKGEETGINALNEMQTNLTLKLESLIEILPLCDEIDISLHYLELTSRGNKLESFNRNFQYLVDNNIQIHNFDIMLENVPDDQIDAFHAQILKYLEYPNIVNSEMIYGFCNYAYNESTEQKHIAFYKKHNKTEQKYIIDGNEYTTNDLFLTGVDCTGWRCNAGIQSLTVNGDGNVFHCGIHMTNHLRSRSSEVPFTNLLTDELAVTKLSILNRTGTICRWHYCGGDFYLHRKKVNHV